MIRVFPSRNNWTPTDDLSFIGDPPLFRPEDRSLPVRVSVSFTWEKDEGERLARAWAQFYDDVQLGGPAYDDPGGEFIPGRFLKEGCTITSRGCPKECPWCVVPKREGRIRELKIQPGWIVQDNNLLACSENHIRAVFDMLRQQERRIFFNGGLDKDFLTQWHRKLLDSIAIGELWVSCDSASDLCSLNRAGRILEGISIRKRRCYVMVGYDSETVAEAERRLEKVLDLGFMPFCQLYRPDFGYEYSPAWKALQRKWARPAAYMSGEEKESKEIPELGYKNQQEMF